MQGWIKSRKISTKSFKRHVENHFKIRQFSLIQNISEANSKCVISFPLYEDFVRMGYSVLLVQSSPSQIMQDKKYDNISMQLIENANTVKTLSDLYVSCVVVLSPSFNVHLQYHHYFNQAAVSEGTDSGKHCLALRFTDAKSEELELLLQLGSHEIAEKWKQTLEYALLKGAELERQKHLYLFRILSNYLQEQHKLQQILSSSDDSMNATSPASPFLSHSPVNNLLQLPLSLDPWQHVSTPPMRIVLMAVGTRGDVQPFISLGLRLQSMGHRVRLATHECFWESIVSKGLEFYPLAGDPHQLSEYMVKTQGCVIPSTFETIVDVPKFHAMVVAIIQSSWKACTEPTPDRFCNTSTPSSPFVADAIISNPVTYGHIHCAEALGVPLHLMFPQPWTPTKGFPHPLSGLPYNIKVNGCDKSRLRSWSVENHASYSLVDSILWTSLESSINSFRQDQLGLEPLRTGSGGAQLLSQQKVPFVKMWSPSLAPKPKDWPDYVDVVGYFGDQTSEATTPISPIEDSEKFNSQRCTNTYAAQGSNNNDINSDKLLLPDNFSPSPELLAFLEQFSSLNSSYNSKFANKTIYLGFGSMKFGDHSMMEKVVGVFLEAAASLGMKIIVQLGWTAITKEKFLELALQAQQKASVLRETERINSDLTDSSIFPSPRLLRSQSVDSGYSNSLKNKSESSGSMQLWSRFISNTFSSIVKSDSTADVNRNPTTASNTSLSSELMNCPTVQEEEYDLVDESHNGSHDDGELMESRCWTATKFAFLVGPCPHSWLFKHVDAVVHHGGAGTTMAGLANNCPTWIIPFFGDQFFWAEVLFQGKLGPQPCPVSKLDWPLVMNGLEVLFSPTTIQAVAIVGEKMRAENGVEGAIHAFYKHLPLSDMLCDVSILLGESRLAQVYCKECCLKMSTEVSDIVHKVGSGRESHLLRGVSKDASVVPCSYVNWSVLTKSTADGVMQGLGGLAHELTGGVTSAICDPLKGIYKDGIKGAATGLQSGITELLAAPIAGSNVLIDKVTRGLKSSAQHRDQLKMMNDCKREDGFHIDPIRLHGDSDQDKAAGLFMKLQHEAVTPFKRSEEEKKRQVASTPSEHLATDDDYVYGDEDDVEDNAHQTAHYYTDSSVGGEAEIDGIEEVDDTSSSNQSVNEAPRDDNLSPTTTTAIVDDMEVCKVVADEDKPVESITATDIMVNTLIACYSADGVLSRLVDTDDSVEISSYPIITATINESAAADNSERCENYIENTVNSTVICFDYYHSNEGDDSLPLLNEPQSAVNDNSNVHEDVDLMLSTESQYQEFDLDDNVFLSTFSLPICLPFQDDSDVMMTNSQRSEIISNTYDDEDHNIDNNNMDENNNNECDIHNNNQENNVEYLHNNIRNDVDSSKRKERCASPASVTMAAFEEALSAQRLFQLLGSSESSYAKRILTYEDFYKTMRTACMHHSGQTPVDDLVDDRNNCNNNDGMCNHDDNANNDLARHDALNYNPSVLNVEKELLNSNLFNSFVKAISRNKTYLTFADFALIYSRVISNNNKQDSIG